MAALEAFDHLGLLKVILPAFTGAKLNAVGLAKFEKLSHSLFPAGASGADLAFLNVLLEKLSPRERSDVLRVFELSKPEADTLKQLDLRAKKLEANLKSARIHKPSQVYEVLEGEPIGDVLTVLYRSTQRVVSIVFAHTSRSISARRRKSRKNRWPPRA